MNDGSVIDHKALGIDPQYGRAQQHKIRRLILEDWQKAGVKLPTYMKLVARYIEATGVPDIWLARLSHQTMDKMLKGVSTPRYEFWACLHIYLARKYGDVSISATMQTDTDILGRALARFGRPESDNSELTGSFRLHEDEGVALAITERMSDGFHHVYLIRRYHSGEPFADAVWTPWRGAGVSNRSRLVAVLRDASREVVGLDVALSDLATLDDADSSARLDALRSAL